MSDFFQYTMPEKYKELFTKEVLKRLSANINAAFGQDVNDAYWWFWLGGTNGWNKALMTTLRTQLPHDVYDDLADYYDKLEWYDSDMFDSEVVELAVSLGVIGQNITDEDFKDEAP